MGTSQDIKIIEIPRDAPAIGEVSRNASGAGATADASTDDAVTGGDPSLVQATVRQISGIAVTLGPEAPDPWFASQKATASAIVWLVTHCGWRWPDGESQVDPENLALEPVCSGNSALNCGVLFIEVVRDGRHIMVIDVGTAETDSHALGLVMRDGGAEFDADMRAIVRTATADEGGRWLRRKINGCSVSHSSRPGETMKNAGKYAKLIERAADRLLKPV